MYTINSTDVVDNKSLVKRRQRRNKFKNERKTSKNITLPITSQVDETNNINSHDLKLPNLLIPKRGDTIPDTVIFDGEIDHRGIKPTSAFKDYALIYVYTSKDNWPQIQNTLRRYKTRLRLYTDSLKSQDDLRPTINSVIMGYKSANNIPYINKVDGSNYDKIITTDFKGIRTFKYKVKDMVMSKLPISTISKNPRLSLPKRRAVSSMVSNASRVAKENAIDVKLTGGNSKKVIVALPHIILIGNRGSGKSSFFGHLPNTFDSSKEVSEERFKGISSLMMMCEGKHIPSPKAVMVYSDYCRDLHEATTKLNDRNSIKLWIVQSLGDALGLHASSCQMIKLHDPRSLERAQLRNRLPAEDETALHDSIEYYDSINSFGTGIIPIYTRGVSGQDMSALPTWFRDTLEKWVTNTSLDPTDLDDGVSVPTDSAGPLV